MFYYRYDSPIGFLGIREIDNFITHINFLLPETKTPLNENDRIIETDLIAKTYKELCEYFERKRKSFSIPLALEGTAFQKKVWKALENIPYGKVFTYKDIALEVNSPKGFRAVGGACNKNPIPIIIPCHRVIGSSGNLTGYAGGLGIKEKLLAIETAQLSLF